MPNEERWYVLKELGEGGQGKVYLVLRGSIYNKARGYFENFERDTKTTISVKQEREKFESFQKAIKSVLDIEDNMSYGALKVLHTTDEARDSNTEKAEARIRKEIKAMCEINHNNLLKIISYNFGSESSGLIEDLDGSLMVEPDKTWFISKFHKKGTLADNKDLFKGNFVGALRAFRPIVEGVSLLHDKDWVHRDIKPQNIFLDPNNNLILGDFGLVFFKDDLHTRISSTFESVGSRDWMPPWAADKRLEEVQPSFDVFSLGKLLWAMISGRTMPFWEYSHPDYNLETIIPNIDYIYMANQLFSKCIVRDEGDCLPNAKVLLEEVDRLLSIIIKNADLIDMEIERSCKVCGIGHYKHFSDFGDSNSLGKIGIQRSRNRKFNIFVCDNCGHIQFFTYFPRSNRPPAWQD